MAYFLQIVSRLYLALFPESPGPDQGVSRIILTISSHVITGQNLQKHFHLGDPSSLSPRACEMGRVGSSFPYSWED